MSEEIARAFVRVISDTTGFKEETAAKIRAALAGLDPAVHVDADTGEAEAKLTSLEVIVREVGQASPSIRVDADTAAADAQLAATEEEARRLGEESPTVRADADTAAAQAQLAGLWSFAAALGPIAIPVVAGGVGGIFGITAALGAATAAAGTAYLGFSGVAGAVKDMGAASEKSGAQSAKSAGAQVQSAQQLQLAEMSLANARANAADQAVAAEERLQTAEQQEKDAQTALTQARQQAEEQLQSYNLQLQDAALAQRQAMLDIEQAKQNLDKTLADPHATELQREQAQLSYDQAVQHNKDLQFQNAQLKEQADAAAKAGVDGSDQVRQAQERLASAQQAVLDAQRAQEAQQRQSALTVAQAQASVASAMRSGAAAAGSMDAATVKLQHDMEDLAPAGQEFAKFVYSLRGDLDGLRATAETGLLPGVEDGIKAVLPLLPQLDAFVGQVASSMGRMADEDLRALNTPYWQQFFSYVDRNAVPTLAEMNDTLGNVAHGFAGLLVAFEPVEQQMGAGLERLSRDFANFGAGAATDSGFQHFLAVVEADGPLVVHTIGDVGAALGSVLAAAAPLGPPLLQVVDLLAHLVSMNPELVALGLEFWAWSRALGSLFGTLQNVTRALGLFAAEEEATAAKTAAATTVMEENAVATAAAGAETEAAGKKAGGAAAAFNPWIAAIAGATLAVTYGFGQIRKYNDELARGEEQALSSKHTFGGLNAELEKQKEALDQANSGWNVFSRLGAFIASENLSADISTLNANVEVLTGTFGLNRDAAVLLGQAAGVDMLHDLAAVTVAVQAYVQQNYAALTSNTGLVGTILEVDAAVYQAKDGFNAYDVALSAVVQTQETAFSSNIDYKQSLSDMEKQLKQNAHTLNQNTDAGRANIKIIDASARSAERDAAATYKTTYENSKLTNETDRRREATAAANAVLDKDVESLIQQGEKAGYSRSQMESLLTQMGLISKTPATAHVGTTGVTPTSKALNDIISQLRYINDHTWYATIAQNVLPPGTPGVPTYQSPLPPSSGTDTLNLLLNPTPRARGGGFDARQMLLVGESGPEIVEFDRPGNVIPNHQVAPYLGPPVQGADDGALLAELRALRSDLRQTTAAVLSVAPSMVDGLNGVARHADFRGRGTVSVYG